MVISIFLNNFLYVFYNLLDLPTFHENSQVITRYQTLFCIIWPSLISVWNIIWWDNGTLVMDEISAALFIEKP